MSVITQHQVRCDRCHRADTVGWSNEENALNFAKVRGYEQVGEHHLCLPCVEVVKCAGRPVEGVTKCFCGVKYWNFTTDTTFVCASCGEKYRP